MTRRCAGIGRMAQAIPGGRRSATCTKLWSSNGDPVPIANLEFRRLHMILRFLCAVSSCPPRFRLDPADPAGRSPGHGVSQTCRIEAPAHFGTYALPTGTYSTGWYEAVKRRFIIPDDDGPVRVRHDASKGKSPSDSSAQFGLGQPLEVRERCVARGRLFKVGTARGINALASDASRNRLSSCC
jgi:hypothetical protein